MLASCPSLRCSCRKKTSLMQRSRGFGHGVVVSQNCYNNVSSMTAANKAFSLRGLEAGLPAFQLPMFAKCDALKEICSTCLSKESMPFVKSKPPLPTRSLRSPRAAARSTSSLCLHHAYPFVAAAEKRPVSCREAEGLVTELWSPRIVTIYCILIMLLYDCCKESF